MRSIALIGMAGVGKSAVGKVLAQKLACGFLDIDEIMERRIGTTLQQYLKDFGDEKFLEAENEAVLELKPDEIKNCVISPGGSIVYLPEAMNFLGQYSKVVFLSAPLERILKQMSSRPERGIVGLDEKNLEEVFRQRLPLYKKYADVVVEINDGDNIEKVADKIIAEI